MKKGWISPDSDPRLWLFENMNWVNNVIRFLDRHAQGIYKFTVYFPRVILTLALAYLVWFLMAGYHEQGPWGVVWVLVLIALVRLVYGLHAGLLFFYRFLQGQYNAWIMGWLNQRGWVKKKKIK